MNFVGYQYQLERRAKMEYFLAQEDEDESDY